MTILVLLQILYTISYRALGYMKSQYLFNNLFIFSIINRLIFKLSYSKFNITNNMGIL